MSSKFNYFVPKKKTQLSPKPSQYKTILSVLKTEEYWGFTCEALELV